MQPALEKDLAEQFLETMVNRKPTGYLCNLGIQYIISKLLLLLLLESLKGVVYSRLP